MSNKMFAIFVMLSAIVIVQQLQINRHSKMLGLVVEGMKLSADIDAALADEILGGKDGL